MRLPLVPSFPKEQEATSSTGNKRVDHRLHLGMQAHRKRTQLAAGVMFFADACRAQRTYPHWSVALAFLWVHACPPESVRAGTGTVQSAGVRGGPKPEPTPSQTGPQATGTSHPRTFSSPQREQGEVQSSKGPACTDPGHTRRDKQRAGRTDRKQTQPAETPPQKPKELHFLSGWSGRERKTSGYC